MEYIDNRDWPEYNAQLVRIGEFYLDLSCVKNWSWELREMNRKKTGAPYKYPCTFITFASIIYSFLRLPYRQLEGFIGRLSTYEPGLVAADYTTLHKRISKQKLEIEIPGIKIRENAIVGKDASSRSTAVLEFKKMGYKGWKQMHQYGRRWAVEGFFSSIKRIFGETVRASKSNSKGKRYQEDDSRRSCSKLFPQMW